MGRTPKCSCGSCRECERRMDRYARRTMALSKRELGDLSREEFFGNSFNLFRERDLYFGTLPKNGRVSPKPSLS